MVPVRDSFNYNEWIVSMNGAVYSLFQFQFFYLHTFYKPNNIKAKPSTKLNLVFKFNSIKRQINIPLWTHMEQRTFIRCYTIALKFWDEFNGNFVLLYFSSYRSIKIWHVYLKNVEKNNKAVHLRLLFTYLHQNLINIKKHLALVLKKNWPCIFLCIPN